MPTATSSRRACSSAAASSVGSAYARRAWPAAPAGRAVDRRLAPAQALDLLGVDVDAPHLAAQLREAGGAYQADVAGTDYADGSRSGSCRDVDRQPPSTGVASSTSTSARFSANWR